MAKRFKKRIVSSVTALAMVLSLGTANALDFCDAPGDETEYVKAECERVEELPDGGKIYIYDIDGEESRFPVPPDGFTPLTATDEQLMTYGFPPRPSEENTEDYEDWVELMKNYKSTPVPEIELSEVMTDDNNNSSSRAALSLNNTMAGYGSYVEDGSYYYSQLQMDFVQPTIFPTTKNSSEEMCLGFGIPFLTQKNIVAGTKKVYTEDLHAFFRVVGTISGPSDPITKEFKVENFSVRPKDKIHIYMSFQRANNLLNIYFANSTTGEAVPILREFSTSEYYFGKTAAWGVYRPVHGDLCGFASVTLQNCKAMTNISDTWTDLSKLESLHGFEMNKYSIQKAICETSDIVNNNTFTCTWKATS